VALELERKPDAELVLKRFDAWWRCEVLDRPLVSLPVVPETAAHPPRKEHASLRDRWLDVEHRVAELEAWLDVGIYLGERLPCVWPNLGPEITAALFGSELEFSDNTSWSVPVLDNVRDIIGQEPDFQNIHWRTIHGMMDLMLERGRGKWLTGITDLHMDADLLAALRDPQELCLDIALDPEGVRAACDYVTELFPRVYDDLYRPIAEHGLPAFSWIEAPFQGRMGVTQCDFICMISPDSFRQTILPSLRAESQYLDRSIYHLDGPTALVHLDDLLAIDELHGIQWVAGAGNGGAKDWIHVYKRIQEAGKCMQILITDLDDARALMPHLRPEGVWFCDWQAYSRTDVEAFIEEVDRWGQGFTPRND
jgi:hypothetical protein